MSTEYSTEFAPLLTSDHGAQQQAGGINIKRLIRLRGPLMLAVTLVLAVPLALAAWFTATPEYTARTFIRIHSVTPTILDEGRGATPRGDYNIFVETQVRLIGDSTILSLVAADSTIQNLEVVQNSPDPLHFLRNNVNVRNERGSELISISCTLPNRQEAMMIVAKVAEVYSRYVTNIQSAGVGQTRGLLVEERDSIEQSIDLQRSLVADLKRRANIPMARSRPRAEIGLEFYHDRLGQAQSELTTAQSNLTRIERTLERIEALREKHAENPSAPIREFDIESAVLSDLSVGMLRQQEAQLAQRVAEYESRYREDIGVLSADRRGLETTRTQLEQAKREARTDALASIADQFQLEHEQAETRVEEAQKRVTQFQETISEQERELESMAQAMINIDEEEARLEQLRNRYQRVVERIRIIDVEERAPGRVDAPGEVTAPTEPSFGRRKQLAALAVIFSMGAGVGLGLLMEFTDQRIRGPQDLRYVTDLPIIAAVPHTSADKLPKGVNPALLTSEHPASTTADEYRRIITRVIYPPEGSAELNTVLVASPSRGDGKTSLACNLAASLAMANRRVLLVDISARRPSVEKAFGLPRGPGLSEIFAGEASANEVIRETRLHNLFVLGPGNAGDQVIGRLASRDVVEFLENAERAFEHVIIDTPPSLLMSDAKLLAPVVDGVILVVGSDVSSIGMVKRCVGEMRQIGANIVGIALNGIRPERGGYLRDNLSKYYAYSSDDEDGRYVQPDNGRDVSAQEEEEEPANILLIDEENPFEPPEDDRKRSDRV